MLFVVVKAVVAATLAETLKRMVFEGGQWWNLAADLPLLETRAGNWVT